MIVFNCPKCREQLSVPDSLADQSETCPNCGNVSNVPKAKGPKAEKQCPECKEQIDKKATLCPHCRSKQMNPQWMLIIMAAVFIVAIAWMIAAIKQDQEESKKSAEPHAKKIEKETEAARRRATKTYGLTVDPTVKLPRYRVLNRKVYDVPIKTQVQLDLLVSDNLAPATLKSLLAKLFLQTDKEQRFKHHTYPTHVFIYAYSDKKRAESGTGGWVAMLSKVGDSGKPSIKVNDKLLALLKQKPVLKFGLTEEQRKEVFKEAVIAERRSLNEMDAKYRTVSSGKATDAQLKEQYKYQSELETKYKAEICKRHSLTDDQLLAIAVEGVKKQWPMP